MEGGTHPTTTHSTSARPSVVSRANSMATMYSYDQLHHFGAHFPRARVEYDKNETSNRFDAEYLRGVYQEQHLGSPNTEHSNPIHAYSGLFPTHLGHHDERQLQLYNRDRSSHALSASVLPSMPHSTMFEPGPPLHARPPSILEYGDSMSSMQRNFPPRRPLMPFLDDTPTPYVAPIPTSSALKSVVSAHPQIFEPFSTTGIGFPVQESTGEKDQVGKAETQQNPNDRQMDLASFEEQIRAIFDALTSDRIITASQLLLDMTGSLLSSVTRLGLHFDDESQYGLRMRLWRNFNHCWEALAQKQRNLLDEEPHVQKVVDDKLSVQNIATLVSELISMCDRIEELGLVDYEMGVWEEQIVNAFIACLDIMEQDKKI